MEEFKAAVYSVCAVSAGICITENLVSATRLKNQIMLMLRLIFAIVIISPFVGGDFRFELPQLDSFDAGDYNYSQELYREELQRQTAENVSEILLQQLNAAGINCTEIATEVNISEDNSISIIRVIISADDFEAAAQIITDSLGSGTEVVNGNS